MLVGEQGDLVGPAHGRKVRIAGLVTNPNGLTFQWIDSVPRILLVSKLQKAVSGISVSRGHIGVSQLSHRLAGNNIYVDAFHYSLRHWPTCRAHRPKPSG